MSVTTSTSFTVALHETITFGIDIPGVEFNPRVDSAEIARAMAAMHAHQELFTQTGIWKTIPETEHRHPVLESESE
jgi:hypothetical protein